MAIQMVSEQGHIKAGIYEFVIDTAAELSQLPTDKKTGSVARCIEDSKVYMLNGSKQWVEVNFKSGGGSGSGSGNLPIHICTAAEYDAIDRIPTIQSPDENTFYLVPAADGASPNMFIEYIYTNNDWEMFGSVSIDLSDYAKKTIISNVSGTTPVITGEENYLYICGEVSTLSFTPSVTGICEVIFVSGATPTVLTLPNTVKMPEWFEVEANMTYEISILNGVYGAVMSWS